MVRWVVGSILHGVDPLSYFSFQPVLHDWCNKDRGMCYPVCGMVHIKDTGVGSGGGGGGNRACVPPLLLIGGGGGQKYVCAPPLLTLHFYFPLELYVYITLTNNYLAFFIYQLILLLTISIN